MGSLFASQRQPARHPVVEECAVLRYCWTLRWLHPAHLTRHLTPWSQPEPVFGLSDLVACVRSGQFVRQPNRHSYSGEQIRWHPAPLVARGAGRTHLGSLPPEQEKPSKFYL